jgi:hypothetical protein
MYSNIVVGVDGRGGGRDAAALAAVLGARSARITFAHVWVTNPVPGHQSDPTFELGDGLVERPRATSISDD